MPFEPALQWALNFTVTMHERRILRRWPGAVCLCNVSNLEIRLLGNLSVLHSGTAKTLPPSRKARALLAYLALNDQAHTRNQLCELFWDAPGDPRASLRWALSKLRPALTVDGVCALQADKNTVCLLHDTVSVDLPDIRLMATTELAGAGLEALIELERRFRSGFLQDLDDTGGHAFQVWLESERQGFRQLHRRVIDALISRAELSDSDRLALAAERLATDALHDDANIEYLRLTLKVAGFSKARAVFERMRATYRAEHYPDDKLVAAWRALASSSESGVALELDDRAAFTTTVESEPVLPVIPEKPSLAILNFIDISTQDGGAVLANGLAIDLNSKLAQLPSLFVISRASASRMDLKRQAPREIASRLGVRYLVTGTTQRGDNTLRATVTLIDAASESELWSEHFDRPADCLFEVQDSIVNAIVAAIEPALEHAEMQRALQKPPESMNAWELFHRGLWHSFRFTSEDIEAASRYFEQSVALDRNFSRAYAGLSFTHYSRAFLNSAKDINREIAAACETGMRSIDCDVRDAMGHWALGRGLFLSRRHDDALAAIDRSLEVNPNYAQGHYARGFIGIHSGRDEAYEPELDVAQRSILCCLQ